MLNAIEGLGGCLLCRLLARPQLDRAACGTRAASERYILIKAFVGGVQRKRHFLQLFLHLVYEDFDVGLIRFYQRMIEARTK